MENLNKLSIVKINQLNKDNTFLAVDSNSWKSPNKVSLGDIILTIQASKLSEQIDNISLVVDPETNKLKVVFPEIVNHLKHNVFYEPFIDHDMSVNRLPKNAAEVSAMHIAIDNNYIYVWVEQQQKWKRAMLSDW